MKKIVTIYALLFSTVVMAQYENGNDPLKSIISSGQFDNLVFKTLLEESFSDAISEIADSVDCKLIMIYEYPSDSIINKKRLLVSLISVDDLEKIMRDQNYMIYDEGSYNDKKIVYIVHSEKRKLEGLELLCASIVKDIDSVKAEQFRKMGQIKGTPEYIKHFEGLLSRKRFRYSITISCDDEYRIEKLVKSLSISGLPTSLRVNNMYIFVY